MVSTKCKAGAGVVHRISGLICGASIQIADMIDVASILRFVDRSAPT